MSPRTGLTDIDTAWGGYAHHTDSRIFREVFRRNTGRLPSKDETCRFAGRLHERFVATVERDGIEETPGASALLRRLAQAPEYAVAFATGGMREVTAAKLALLGASGPVSTATEHTFREHVVLEAMQQAGGGFDRTVCVGDGPWDVRAALHTSSQFVGIGHSTAPFGDWFLPTHLFASFDDVDLTADFTLYPPAGNIARVPEAGAAFTAQPAWCGCWN